MALGALGAGIAGGAGINIIIRATDQFSGVFAKVNKSMLGVGVGITAIGVAGAVVMGGLVKQAISFEDAFIGVRKTVDLTEAQFEELESRFKSLSKTLPLTFEELSGIGEIAGQLGVQGVDNISQFTKTIADISATTNLTAEQAATDFARFANIMNMPINQVDRLGSVVVDLGNNLATTEAEIVSMGMRISGAGRALGMTEGEVMAWAGALSSVGVRAEMGGTAISKLMINISSMVATGSDDLEDFEEVAGITTEEFAKAFEKDAYNDLQKFFEGLSKVEAGGGNVLTVLEELGIKEVRLRDAVLRLSSSYGTLDSALGMQKTAWEENTALSEEAQKRYDSMKSQLIILGNQFKILAAELGEVLFPMIKKVIVLVTSLTDWFSNLTDGQKKFIVIAGVVGVVLALIVGPLLILVAMLPAIAAGLGMMAAGLTAVSIAGLPVWAVILIIAAVIAALIAIGWLLVKHWDKIKEAAARLGVMMKNVFIGIRNVVVSVWNFIVGLIEARINRIIWIINKMIGLINKIPGINIGEIGKVSLGKIKGEMMEYERYVPTPTTTKSPSTTVVNVTDNNIYGTDPTEIAEALQEQIQNKVSMG